MCFYLTVLVLIWVFVGLFAWVVSVGSYSWLLCVGFVLLAVVNYVDCVLFDLLAGCLVVCIVCLIIFVMLLWLVCFWCLL